MISIGSPFGIGSRKRLTTISQYNVGNAVPKVVLDFKNNRYLAGEPNYKKSNTILDFDRASTGYLTDRYGESTSVAVDAPRDNHHIWKDSILTPAGIAISPAAQTNLAPISDPQVSDLLTKSNVSDGALNAGPGLENGIWFYPDALTKYAYTSFNPTIGLEYTFSLFIRMDDGTEPVPGGTGTDFQIVNNNAGIPQGGYTVEQLGNDGLYRMYATRVADTTSPNFGVLKWSSNSGRGFTISGYQIDEGPYPNNYIPTVGSQVSVAAESLQIDPVTLVKSFGEYGPELITNGGFDTDTDWVGSGAAGWAISGGKITHSPGSAGGIYQTVVADQNANHIITVDVSGITAGGANMSLLGDGAGLTALSNGPNRFIIQSGSSGPTFQIYANSDFDGTIDNVSVRKVHISDDVAINGDFSAGLTGWVTINADPPDRQITEQDGVVHFELATGGSTTYFQRTDVGMTIGKLYLMEIDCSEYTSGSLKSDVTGGAMVTVSKAGVNSTVFVAKGTGLNFYRSSSPIDLKIRSIKIREISMPDELTFLMKGTMSRAKDPESYHNAVPFRWQLDGDNYIDMIVSTYSTHTGRPYFRSTKDGVWGGVTSSDDDAIPLGIEKAFSLAFVLSPTEIEGFYNGVSTGKTAYGGMANLLSVPLQLFPEGTATLEEFSIWPEALPSADMIGVTS